MSKENHHNSSKLANYLYYNSSEQHQGSAAWPSLDEQNKVQQQNLMQQDQQTLIQQRQQQELLLRDRYDADDADDSKRNNCHGTHNIPSNASIALESNRRQLEGSLLLPDPNHNFSPCSFPWDDVRVTDNNIVNQTAIPSASFSTMANINQKSKAPVVGPGVGTGPGADRKPPPKTIGPLPDGFVPQPYSILCGQGSEYYNAVGESFFVLFLLIAKLLTP